MNWILINCQRQHVGIYATVNLAVLENAENSIFIHSILLYIIYTNKHSLAFLQMNHNKMITSNYNKYIR